MRSAKAPSIRDGSQLRLLVGSIIAEGQLVFAYPTTTLADDLLECFTLAVSAGATVDSMDYVRRKVMEETPQSYLATAMVQLGLCYCLSSEARLVAAIEFKSRDTVEIMLARMNDAFDEAEIFAADAVDAPSYRAVIELHAAVTRDLVSKSRPLARMVNYDFKDVIPSLWLANRLYGDASRSGELIDENHTIHPAFVQPVGRCLSN